MENIFAFLKRHWLSFALVASGVLLSFFHPIAGLAVPAMAASTLYDITAATATLKELYDGQVVQNLVYKDNPFLAMVPKKEDFLGKTYPIPIQYGVSQGRSATFANAQANIAAPSLVEFQLTRKRDYSIFQLDHETMLASASDIGAFAAGAKIVVDSGIRALKLSMTTKVFRSGTGSVATIGTISTGVITLVSAADVVFFEINMKVQANATDGGTPRAAAGWVVAVDRTAGTVTVASSGLSGSAATPTGWAANDFLLQDGDNNGAMAGLQAWIPTVAPTSTLFFGVDRSVDVVRLGGVRYDGSAQSVEEAQIDASMLVAREGGTPKVGVMSYASFSALEKGLGSKVTYADYQGPAGIAFRGIRVNGGNSTIDVFPDRTCPALTEYLLQLDTWKLCSLGAAPRILEYEDGQVLFRVSNADAMEGRVGFYGNLGCGAPGWNATVKLAA